MLFERDLNDTVILRSEIAVCFRSSIETAVHVISVDRIQTGAESELEFGSFGTRNQNNHFLVCHREYRTQFCSYR